MLAALASLDRRYPDDFGLVPIRGYAEPHELILDLGTAFAALAEVTIELVLLGRRQLAVQITDEQFLVANHCGPLNALSTPASWSWRRTTVSP